METNRFCVGSKTGATEKLQGGELGFKNADSGTQRRLSNEPIRKGEVATLGDTARRTPARAANIPDRRDSRPTDAGNRNSAEYS